MEIKTLKNLEISSRVFYEKIVSSNDLREEAINWVKEQRELFGKNATGDFWMEKLNITEDDLK